MTDSPGTRRDRRPAAALRHHGLLLLVLALAAAPIAYVGYREFDIDDPATGGDAGDSAAYARMALTGDLDGVPKPFRYRVVVPFLARGWMLAFGRPEVYDLRVAFAEVNQPGDAREKSGWKDAVAQLAA